jgi:undecaprenyl-diphosphatase
MPSNPSASPAVWAALTLPLVLVAGGCLALLGGDAGTEAFFRAWRAANPEATRLTHLFTDWGNPAFYLVYGALLARGLRRRDPLPVSRALAYLAAQLAVSLVVERLLKISIGRPRPGVGGPFVPFSLDNAHNSLPSGHTAEMAVQTSCLALWARGMALPLALGLLLALMGASRLIVGAHHPTDVLAGMLLGCLGGVLARSLAPRLAPSAARFLNRKG